MKARKDMKVCVAYPHPVGEVGARFHRSLVNLLVWDAHHRGRVVFGGAHMPVASGAQITKSRNKIVREFLPLEGIDYLWFVDADMEFEPDTLDRLIDAAHPETHPIIGGLCFALMRGERQEIVPTIYQHARDEEGFVRLLDYPRDTLVPAKGTGAACLLIHRSVLERMAEVYPEPTPWFTEEIVHGELRSEDLTFCARAGRLGFPLHVDTRVKLGHVKPVVVDEAMFEAQQSSKAVAPPAEPTVVVIASKSRRQMLGTLLAQIQGVHGVMVLDNGYEPPLEGAVAAHGWPLHRMWNYGLDEAEKMARETGCEAWNVAILNDDLEVAPDALVRLAAGLRQGDDHWIAYPDFRGQVPDNVAMITTAEGQTISGWCFMIRGESGLRFDEQFEWWYGDTDLEMQTRAAGKNVVAVGGCHVNHLDPIASTQTNPERVAQAKADEARYAAKWNVDPSSLWLANHPEFGK